MATMDSEEGTSSTRPTDNLPWVEKYRPNNLDELIAHEDIIRTIAKFIKENRLPHLLLYGPPGTGKTSTILAAAKTIYSPKELGAMVLELNASDDRGIGIVRGEVMNFASTQTIFNRGFKLIILDEADAMTQDAQNALRRIIEKYTVNTRFCLVCNYLSKIIPAIQSRCTRFRFAPLSVVQMIPRLDYVIEQEGLNVTDDGKSALITLSKGDMRKVLNVLQSTSMAFEQITEENVYRCCGQPMKGDIKQIIGWLLRESVASAYKKIWNMQIEKGLALHDIITQIAELQYEECLPDKTRMEIIEKIANVEYYLASGSSDKLQLGALVAAFQSSRDLKIS